MLLAPVLAGMTLAACTGGQGVNASQNESQAPASHGTTSKPAPTKATSPTKTPPATSGHRKPEGLAGCLPYTDLSKYKNHEYEVCTAYIANSAEIALRGFYKYGNSRVGYLADAAKHHFETRYWQKPRRAIERDVASWPKSSSLLGNDTDVSITLRSLSSNLSADRALLKTRESWQVTSPDGKVLHNEPLHKKEITMCRGKLPGHPLHEWVVVSPSLRPNYDCIGFDKAHNLAP
jgi:hypothetical protein